MTAAKISQPAERRNDAEQAEPTSAQIHEFTGPRSAGERFVAFLWTRITRNGVERNVEARLVFQGNEVDEIAWSRPNALELHAFTDDEAERVIAEYGKGA